MAILSQFEVWKLTEAIEATTGHSNPKEGDQMFWNYVLEERLVLCGRRNGEGDRIVIPKEELSKLTLRDHKGSRLQSDEPSNDSFLDVLVYPVVSAPDREERLAGMTLKEVYHCYVRGDPEVQHLIKISDVGPDGDHNPWRDKRYYPLQFSWLPLSLYSNGDRQFMDTSGSWYFAETPALQFELVIHPKFIGPSYC